jgi:hypothetical protein
LIALAVLAGLLLGAAASAGAASAPNGGSIAFFGTPTGNLIGGTILVTGAIGDHGTYLTIDRSGKPDLNGAYVRVTLTKGSFELNDTTLNARASHASPAINEVTCSGATTVTAPVPILDGTGLYRGISGSASVTEFFAFLLSHIANGKCDAASAATPIARYFSIIGGGSVRFG